jgi:NADPH:quinone reductase-like Zn-dependent oxidoreductase
VRQENKENVMKAIVCPRYGPPKVLRLQEVEKPSPAGDQVLVRVHAASLNYPDWRFLRAKPVFLRFTRGAFLKPPYPILGSDIAGRVEAVGSGVTQFRPGDEVFGDTSAHGFGAFAEYVSVSETALATKPANVTFEQAAAVPMAALVALQGLRLGGIQAGQKVLVVGASGGNGTFAVQIAKAFGAQVTGVCSTRNVDLVRSIGADNVIDYTHEDFSRGGQLYDLIVATAGYRPLGAYRRALSPDGAYIVTGGSMAQIVAPMFAGELSSGTGDQTLTTLSHEPKQEDLLFMAKLLEAGKVVPVIDRCYPLSETAKAFAYYGKGHARGKVVITVANTNGGG